MMTYGHTPTVHTESTLKKAVTDACKWSMFSLSATAWEQKVTLAVSELTRSNPNSMHKHEIIEMLMASSFDMSKQQVLARVSGNSMLINDLRQLLLTGMEAQYS